MGDAMKITEWNGEKITAPGIYAGMPIEYYHGNCCDGPSISSSGLRCMEMKSPAHYWASSALNPERVPQPEKSAFEFGRAAHCLLLGEGEFQKRFAIRPERFEDYRTVEARQWRLSVRSARKTPVTADEIEIVRGMARSLEREPLIQSGLMTGQVELSMFWKDEKTGVWLKSRPDAVPSAGEILADLKTAADVSYEGITKSVSTFGYHMQGALALMGMKAITGRAAPSFALIFVEKAPPFAVSIVQIDSEALLYGARQIRRSLDEFAACLKSGEWPGPLRGQERTVGLTGYWRSRLQQEDEAFTLPKVNTSTLFEATL